MAPKPRYLRRTLTFAAALGLAATVALTGCRGDPPLPPDPEMPTPPTACDEVPLTLARIEADSTLDKPGWVQVCTACPVAEADVSIGDGAGAPLPTQTMWSPLRECIVGLPTDPLPARPSAPVSVDLVSADGRVAEYDFDLPLPAGRGQNPVEFGPSTWHLPLPDDAFRLLGGLDVLPAPPRGVLIALGPADAQNQRTVTIAPVQGDGPAQDRCTVTSSWEIPASLLSRQVATAVSTGDVLPGRVVAERGAFQARLTESGDALLDVTLMALVSLPLSESAYGMPPDAACAFLADDLGFDPCVPCGSPTDGLAGLPACIPLLIEGARAERVDSPLLSIDSVPPDCRQPTPLGG